MEAGAASQSSRPKPSISLQSSKQRKQKRASIALPEAAGANQNSSLEAKRVSFALTEPRATQGPVALSSGGRAGRFSRLSTSVITALRFTRLQAGSGRQRSASAVNLSTPRGAASDFSRRASAYDRIRRPKRDPSGLADLDEDGSGNAGRMRNAIYNEEIASLRIRDEDLDKIAQDVRAAATVESSAVESPEPTSSRRIAVRREIPAAQRRPPLRRFALLRRAPLDEESADVDNAAESADTAEPRIQQSPPGPRLDRRGIVVPHSLLGKPEEFYRMGLRRGHIRPEDLPPAYQRLASEDCRLGEDALLLLLPAGHCIGENSASPLGNSTGNGVQCHWMPPSSYPPPGLEISDRPIAAAQSAREHNRRLLARSGYQMRRLTEQLDQCFAVPDAPSERSKPRSQQWPGGGDRHQQRRQKCGCRCGCRSRQAARGETGGAFVLLHRRLGLPEGGSARLIRQEHSSNATSLKKVVA